MYAKIFASMYDGSLYGQWEAIVTFQQMLVLADQDGNVDISAAALAARTSIPLEIIQKGLALLEAPDPRSRTPDEDGRRIVRLEDHRDWGWNIINYVKYREIRYAEERREYLRTKKAESRARQKTAQVVNSSQQPSTMSTDADASKDAFSFAEEGESRGEGVSTTSEQVVEKPVENFSDCAKLIIACNQGTAASLGENYNPIPPSQARSMDAAAEILKLVPLDFALEAVREIASTYKPSGRSKQITSLRYCQNGVIDRWERHQAKTDASGPALGMASSKFKPRRAAAPPVAYRKDSEPERVSPEMFQSGIEKMKQALKS